MNHIVFARHFGEGIPTMPVIPRLVIEPETQRSTNLGLNASGLLTSWEPKMVIRNKQMSPHTEEANNIQDVY